MSIELGEMLVAAGKITRQQLEKAQSLQKDGSGKLVASLVKIGAIKDENEISEFVGKQLNIGALRLSDVELNPDVVKLIPLDIARKFNVIAVSKLGKTLIVAISDPGNIYVLDAIKFITGCNIQPVISPEKAIQKSIDGYYKDPGAYNEILKGMEEEGLEVVEIEDDPSEVDLRSQIQDKPLVKLVDSIIGDAIRRGASDIHLETYEKENPGPLPRRRNPARDGAFTFQIPGSYGLQNEDYGGLGHSRASPPSRRPHQDKNAGKNRGPACLGSPHHLWRKGGNAYFGPPGSKCGPDSFGIRRVITGYIQKSDRNALRNDSGHRPDRQR
jgi:hypothetical protein